jgi:hypothetical protein
MKFMNNSWARFSYQTNTSNQSTLTVKCCVKIQNDCSDPFEAWQGLRQGDVLWTLLFNVVLEAIVWRPKLHKTGTIFNKQAQLLGYADDADTISRSLEAVRDVYLALEAAAAKLGLKINEQKTKYMIADENRTILDARQTGTSDKDNDLQDLDKPVPAARQWNVGADKKGSEPTTRL